MPDPNITHPGLGALTLAAITALSSLAVAVAFLCAFRWLSELIPRFHEDFSRYARARLNEAFVFVSADWVLGGFLLLVAAMSLGALWWLGSAWIALLVMAAAGLLPRLAFEALRARRRERWRLQLPDLLVLLSSALRAGASVGLAFRQVADEIPAPASQEIGLVLSEQRMGVELDQALRGLEHRMPLAETRLMVTALRINRETGGNLAEAFDGLAVSLRRQMALEAKVQAVTAQGKLQGWAMALLPFMVGAALWRIDPQAMEPLVQTMWGRMTCAAVVLMQLTGMLLVRRITRIDF